MNRDFNILHFNAIDSTNAYALENIKTLPHNTVITADEQFKGRGRFERHWVSDSIENLYVSIIIKPEIPYRQLPIVNFPQLFSVVVAEAFLLYGAVPQIKWPNDVLINKKKCAGILGEAAFDGNVFNGIVIGVGVNIADNPAGRLVIKQPATSLVSETGRHVEKNDFLANMLDIYVNRYSAFCKYGFAAIHDVYKKYFAYIGKEVSLVSGGQNISGRTLGLSDCGDLVLQTASGETKNITMGEILWKTS